MKQWSVGLALLLLAVGFFSPYIGQSQIPYVGDFTGSDLTELNIPLRFMAAEAIRSGELPLWTNLLSTGYPLLAEGQAGFFYPLNLISFPFLPLAASTNISIISTFFLASGFMYLLARRLGISSIGAAIGGIAFAYSGFFIFHLKHLNLINAAAWLPLAVYVTERYFSARRKSLVAISLAAVLAVQFFAGHPQISYITVVTCIVYFVFRSIQSGSTAKLFTSALFWITVGAVSVGLSAVQLLPSYEYASSTNRTELIYEAATQYQYPAAFLTTSINPFRFGNPADNTYQHSPQQFGVFWENALYLGLLPLLLVGFFVGAGTFSSTALSIFLLGVVSLLLVFGDASPIFSAGWQLVPGFSLFRFPQRFLLVTTFALALLAGFGYDALIGWAGKYTQQLQKFIRSTALQRWLLISLVLAAVVVDLFVVAIRYVGTINLEQYVSEPPSVSWLRQDSDDFRIISVGWMEAWRQTKRLSGGWLGNPALFLDERLLLPPNSNAFFNIASVDDRSMFEGGWGGVDRLNQLLTFFGSGIFYDWNGVANELTPAQLRVFGLLNVKYILSYAPLTLIEGLESVATIETQNYAPLHVYRNSYFQPRVRAFFDITPVESRAAVLEALAGAVDADTLLTDAPVAAGHADSAAAASINIIRQRDTELLVQIDFSQNGYLYFSQVVYPGWRATVDGQAVEIIPAFLAMTAIPVPVGVHEVRLWYAPDSFAIGAIISVTTLILLVLYVGFILRFKKKYVSYE